MMQNKWKIREVYIFLLKLKYFTCENNTESLQKLQKLRGCNENK